MEIQTKIHSIGSHLFVEATCADGGRCANAWAALEDGKVEDAEDRARARLRAHMVSGAETTGNSRQGLDRPPQQTNPPEQTSPPETQRDDQNPEWESGDMEALANDLADEQAETLDSSVSKVDREVPASLLSVLRDTCEQAGVRFRQPRNKSEAIAWIRMLREDSVQELPDIEPAEKSDED